MTERRIPETSPERFVPPAVLPVASPLLRVPLQLSDRVLLVPGGSVEAGQPLVERFREQEMIDVATDAALLALRPGDPVDRALAARRDRRAARLGGRARVVGHGRDGRTRLAMGRHDIAVFSPVAGRAEAVLPARIDLRAQGVGIPGRVAFGRPVHGRILVAASGPNAELRSSSIDVSAAGAILVVGARLDIEAISRARAIGVAGVISGGIVGRELRQLEEAEVRQRAALHPAAPFALLAFGGYGRRPIPPHVWSMLVAAEGRPAGILPEGSMLVIGGDPEPLLAAGRRAAGAVAVTAGEHAGREGRLLGLAGARRWPGGSHGPGAFVEVEVAPGMVERVCVPVSDLERLG
jgi:hypothetical protein